MRMGMSEHSPRMKGPSSPPVLRLLAVGVIALAGGTVIELADSGEAAVIELDSTEGWFGVPFLVGLAAAVVLQRPAAGLAPFIAMMIPLVGGVTSDLPSPFPDGFLIIFAIVFALPGAIVGSLLGYALDRRLP